jgi:amino acid transporter
VTGHQFSHRKFVQVLFLDYVVQALGQDELAEHPITRFLLLAVAASILGYINWLGLDIVGKMSFVICIIAMSPFVILSLVGAFHVNPLRWLELPVANNGNDSTSDTLDLPEDTSFLPFAASSAVMWRPFLNNLFWNLNSFDSAASFAADVVNPGTVIPKAMFYSVVIVVAGYFVPLLIALGASDSHQNDWVDGYFANVAEEVVGKWLGDYIILAAGVSNIALFQAELSTDAFQLMGMAERRLAMFFYSLVSKAFLMPSFKPNRWACPEVFQSPQSAWHTDLWYYARNISNYCHGCCES